MIRESLKFLADTEWTRYPFLITTKLEFWPSLKINTECLGDIPQKQTYILRRFNNNDKKFQKILKYAKAY